MPYYWLGTDSISALFMIRLNNNPDYLTTCYYNRAPPVLTMKVDDVTSFFPSILCAAGQF